MFIIIFYRFMFIIIFYRFMFIIIFYSFMFIIIFYRFMFRYQRIQYYYSVSVVIQPSGIVDPYSFRDHVAYVQYRTWPLCLGRLAPQLNAVDTLPSMGWRRRCAASATSFLPGQRISVPNGFLFFYLLLYL